MTDEEFAAIKAAVSAEQAERRKAKQAEYQRRPEIKAKKAEYYRKPEVKAKKAEYQREYYQRVTKPAPIAKRTA